MSVAIGQHHLMLQVLLYEPQRPGGGGGGVIIILDKQLNARAHAYTVTYFPEAVKSA